MFSSLPYINEALMLSSALTMAVGWWQIRKNRVRLHKWLMLTSVVLAALFFISYALKTVLIGDTSFGGSANLRIPYQAFLQMHSVLATVGGLLGLLTLRFVFKKRFGSHKKIGRVTAPIWFVTAASGLAVFLLLYVIFPPGPTVNMFQAWLGHH